METPESWENISDRFAAMGAAVAAALDALSPASERGWRHVRALTAYGRVQLEHPAGWELNLAWNGSYRKGAAGRRVTVSGVLPPEYRGREAHEITVGLDRKPEAIAADIARRLLPAYKEAARATLGHVAEELAHRQRREAAIGQMQAALPALSPGPSSLEHGYATFRDGSAGRRPHRAYAHGRVRLAHDGRSGRLEADGIPLEVLLEMLALLNADPRPLEGRVMPRKVGTAVGELEPAARVIAGEVLLTAMEARQTEHGPATRVANPTIGREA
ncbi:hypothetical protein [Streptomyces sp. NRRL B-24484]|uniref:hypothetical protein n=1 Tax=Streptomyces sp. NRRL B-24484 TaxID=1463833 RepID=UPI0004C1D293|nr:hypothetical protein [Streptomyces sp. NRRL B-24484]